MLVRRLRLRSNIEPTLGEGIVFAGLKMSRKWVNYVAEEVVQFIK